MLPTTLGSIIVDLVTKYNGSHRESMPGYAVVRLLGGICALQEQVIGARIGRGRKRLRNVAAMDTRRKDNSSPA